MAMHTDHMIEPRGPRQGSLNVVKDAQTQTLNSGPGPQIRAAGSLVGLLLLAGAD